MLGLTTCLATGIVVRQCILQIIPIRIVLESVQTYLTGLSHVHMHGLFKENEASYRAYIKNILLENWSTVMLNNWMKANPANKQVWWVWWGLFSTCQCSLSKFVAAQKTWTNSYWWKPPCHVSWNCFWSCAVVDICSDLCVQNSLFLLTRYHSQEEQRRKQTTTIILNVTLCKLKSELVVSDIKAILDDQIIAICSCSFCKMKSSEMFWNNFLQDPLIP